MRPNKFCRRQPLRVITSNGSRTASAIGADVGLGPGLVAVVADSQCSRSVESTNTAGAFAAKPATSTIAKLSVAKVVTIDRRMWDLSPIAAVRRFLDAAWSSARGAVLALAMSTRHTRRLRQYRHGRFRLLGKFKLNRSNLRRRQGWGGSVASCWRGRSREQGARSREKVTIWIIGTLYFWKTRATRFGVPKIPSFCHTTFLEMPGNPGVFAHWVFHKSSNSPRWCTVPKFSSVFHNSLPVQNPAGGCKEDDSSRDVTSINLGDSRRRQVTTGCGRSRCRTSS